MGTIVHNIKQKDGTKAKCLLRFNSSVSKECKKDTGVNGRLACISKGTLAWCGIRDMEYACEGCFSCPSLQ